MLQVIKIVIEELIVNIQIQFLVLWQYNALNYWKIKEICKQQSYNEQVQNQKTNKKEKLLNRKHQT